MLGVVQHNEMGATGSVTLAWNRPTVSGNVLLAWANSDTTVATPTASGVTFTLVQSFIFGNAAYVWIARSAASAGSVTFTTTGSFGITCGILEVSGVDNSPSNIYDQFGGAHGTSLPAIATATTTATDYIVFIAMEHGSISTQSISDIVWGQSQVPLTSVSCRPLGGGSFQDSAVATLTNVAAGSVSGSWTSAGFVSGDVDTFWVALKSLVSGQSIPSPTR